jgi:hypothetical protein
MGIDHFLSDGLGEDLLRFGKNAFDMTGTMPALLEGLGDVYEAGRFRRDDASVGGGAEVA